MYTMADNNLNNKSVRHPTERRKESIEKERNFSASNIEPSKGGSTDFLLLSLLWQCRYPKAVRRIYLTYLNQILRLYWRYIFMYTFWQKVYKFLTL